MPFLILSDILCRELNDQVTWMEQVCYWVAHQCIKLSVEAAPPPLQLLQTTSAGIKGEVITSAQYILNRISRYSKWDTGIM